MRVERQHHWNQTDQNIVFVKGLERKWFIEPGTRMGLVSVLETTNSSQPERLRTAAG
jgi:hypothetical protein